MKNFYEVTDIDVSNSLTVMVELVEHNNPKYLFTVNEVSVQTNCTLLFDLLTNLHFKCYVENGAIEIKKISINAREIMPVYLNLSEPPTNWITNKWSLSIAKPFYPWYHEITGQGWIA